MCLDQPTDGDKIWLERVWRMCFIGLRSHQKRGLKPLVKFMVKSQEPVKIPLPSGKR